MLTYEQFLQIKEQEGSYFEFNYKGYQCIGKRHKELGTWCGYVVVSPELLPDEYSVHTEITWKGKLPWAKEDLREVIGFDCSHAGDWIPMFHSPEYMNLFGKFRTTTAFEGDIYRTREFVESELKQLVDQLPPKEELLNGDTNL